MRTFAAASLVVAALAVMAPSRAEAKDLTGRVGVGYINNLPGTGSGASLLLFGEAPGGSAISTRYWLNNSLGLQGDLGVSLVSPDGGDDANNFGLGFGAQYVFVHEPNLHVYGAGGLSFGSISVSVVDPATGATTTDSNTAIGVNLGVGTEFFFVGTPNLGFTTQFGLSFVQVSDVASVISLSGGEFAQFGIRYYFGGPKGPGG